MLSAASESIKGAPQTGFLDLDTVQISLQQACAYLQKIAPELELGQKFRDDFQVSLEAKLRALKYCGGTQLISQAQRLLIKPTPDFAELKTLQKEIDQALQKMFNGPRVFPESGPKSNPGDYR